MKLSAGTIGTVLFTAAGIAVFVLMAKRPAVDGYAMNFGMPMQSAVVEEKMPEATAPKAAPTTETTTTTSMPEAAGTEMPVTPEVEPAEAKVEPVKVEETTPVPATSETSMPAPTDTEIKTEEMPADAPAVDGSTTTN